MPASCFDCVRRSGCVVQSLNDSELDHFSSSLSRFSIRGKNRAIFNQGQPIADVYFLCDGVVKATRTLADGSEVIVDIQNAFSIMEWSSVYLRTPRFLSRFTVSSVADIAYMRQDAFREMLARYPSLLGHTLSQQAESVLVLYKLVTCMKLAVRDRLLALLGLSIFVQDQEFVSIPLSNIELAQFAQTTPETVSRVFNQLHAQGHTNRDESGKVRIRSELLRATLSRVFAD